MEGIVQIQDFIEEERTKGNNVLSRQGVLIYMMETVAEIRFKLKTAPVPDETIYYNPKIITDLSIVNEASLSDSDLLFHIATVIYDIDTISLMMQQDLNNKKEIPNNVRELMEILVNQRDEYQMIFNERQ